MGHNKIAIVIPCHRVVGTDGSLTGYAAGLDRKLALLETEHVDVRRFLSSKLAFYIDAAIKYGDFLCVKETPIRVALATAPQNVFFQNLPIHASRS